MMINWRRAALACAAGLLATSSMMAGCSTPSVNPAYSKDEHEVFADDRVIGMWVEVGEDGGKEKKDDVYRVTAPERREGDESARVYTLVVEDRESGTDKSGRYDARLVRLGAYEYLDLYPAEPARKDAGEKFGLGMMPMHIIMPMRIRDDRLELRPLDPDRMKTMLRASPRMTPHVLKDGDVVVLTGTTEEVQDFFRRIVGAAEGEEPFGKTMVLERMTERKLPEQKPADAGAGKAPPR